MTIEAFSEERFPLRVAFASSGGPERTTEIVRLSNGYEQRNQRHRHSRRRYDAGSGVKSLRDLVAVFDFFEARRGKLTGFRFRDPLDWRSSPFGREPDALDQELDPADGARRDFQLTKTYGTGDGAYRRVIEKPLGETVRVAVDGNRIDSGFAVDPVRGTITFDAPPIKGARVTAGFAFDVPVRFDIDHLAIDLSGFEAGSIPTIPLVEIRP